MAHAVIWRGSQCSPAWKTGTMVLPSKPQPEFPHGLNVVRSGRPEQSLVVSYAAEGVFRSQCSPVWKTGTIQAVRVVVGVDVLVSM